MPIEQPKRDAKYRARSGHEPLIAFGVGAAAGLVTGNPAIGVAAGGLTAAALGGREGYRQARMDDEDKKRKKRKSTVRTPGRAQTSRTLASARR